MKPSRHVRHVLLFFFTLFTAVWVGGSILTDLVLIPGAFRSLARNDAIAFGADAFGRVNFLECILGASAILIAFALGRSGWGTPARHRLAVSLACSMTAISLAFLLFLTPAIIYRVKELLASGFDFADLGENPPERASLRTIHHVYVALDAAKILCGIGLFWLLASRSRSQAA